MKAIILAAGYGTRLLKSAIGTEYEDYIRKTPKPLLEIGDRPLINYLLDKLAGVDVDEVRIIFNKHKPYQPKFKEWSEQNKEKHPFNVTIIYNDSEKYGENLGAVRDLSIALGFNEEYDVKEFNEDCIVLFGDRWPSVTLEDMVNFMKEKDSSIVGLYDVGFLEKMKGKSQVKLSNEKRVIFFEEKSKNPTETITCPGFYFLKRNDYELIKDFLQEEKLPDAPGYFIQHLFNKKIPLHGYELDTEPFDFGDLPAYLEAKEKLKP